MRWKKVRVGSVCDQIRGVSYNGEEASDEFLEDYIPLLRANNISNGGFLNFDKIVYVPQKRVRSEQLIRVGDIVVAASSGSKEIVGKAAPSKENWNGSFGAFCKVIRPKNIYAAFLNYYFQSPLYRITISALSEGANINNLRNEHIDSLQIPLPDLPTQQHIAAVLDKADALRQHNQQLLTYYDELLQSTFIELFGDPVTNEKGWEVRKLGEVADIQGGLQVSSDSRKNLPLDLPYLRVANVYRNYLDLSEIKNIKLTPAELQRVKLKKNDLLIVEGHGNKDEIGRAAIWDGSIDPIVHQNHLIRVRPTFKEILPIFLCYFINSDFGKNQLRGSSNTTSGLNTISTGKVKNVIISLPPPTLQNQFADIVERIEAQKAQAQAALTESEALFEGLLAGYFGENQSEVEGSNPGPPTAQLRLF